METILIDYIEEFIIKPFKNKNFLILNNEILYFSPDNFENQFDEIFSLLVKEKIISRRYTRDITKLKKLLDFLNSSNNITDNLKKRSNNQLLTRIEIAIKYRIFLIEKKIVSINNKNTEYLKGKFIEYLKKNYFEIKILKNTFLYNPEKIEIKLIDSLESFITQNNLMSKNSKNSENLFYRGHANIEWELLPSIYRNSWIETEHKMFREILIRNPEEFMQTTSTFEKLTKMQHYGLPTRLLDITKNPLVALYFACCDKNEKKAHGEVLYFDPENELIKYFDSDKVCILSNLAKCERSLSKKNKKDFNETYSEGLKLLHLIKEDKPHFTNNIDPNDFEKNLIVKPINNNNRIKRQSGYFFLFGFISNIKKPATINCRLKIKNKELKLIIESSKKEGILKELDNLNINSESLFPEIEKGTEYIKEKYV